MFGFQATTLREFPRSRDRGPIEAPLVRIYFFFVGYFRDHVIAAPLKPVLSGFAMAGAALFPRSRDRGPIEASYAI